MNGKRYILDTNAVIQLLAGNLSLIKMVEESECRHRGDRAGQPLRGHHERRPFRPPEASPGKDI